MGLQGQVLATVVSDVHATPATLISPGAGEQHLLTSLDFFCLSGASQPNEVRLYITKSGGSRFQIASITLEQGENVPWHAERHIFKNGDLLEFSSDVAAEVNGVATGIIRT